MKKIREAKFDLSNQDKKFINDHNLQDSNEELANYLLKLAPSISGDKIEGTYQEGDIFHIYVQDKKANSKKAYYNVTGYNLDHHNKTVLPTYDKKNAIFFKFTKFRNSKKSFFENTKLAIYINVKAKFRGKGCHGGCHSSKCTLKRKKAPA